LTATEPDAAMSVPQVIRHPRRLHPMLIMLGVLLLAVALTHVIPSGKFERHAGQVVPGSYHIVAKSVGPGVLLAAGAPTAGDQPARAAGFVALLAAIPAGMIASAGLIFMVLFFGGLFGVLRCTGAIDAGVDRLMYITSGNVYLLTLALMLMLALGSTFLGLYSEYLVIIPLVALVGQRLGLPNLFSVAVVIVGARIGYAASVTNPVALAVAQPLAGVPVFSGLGPRLAIFLAMLVLGMGYVLLYLRRVPRARYVPHATRLPLHQVAVLVCLVLGGVAVLIATRLWSWSNVQLSGAFIGLSVLLAVVGRLRGDVAADAFVEGMKSMLLAGLLIGLAGAVEVILESSQVLDTLINGITRVVQGHAPGMVAAGVMVAEMALDVFIPSVSGKAAISMPILAPVAHLSGLSGQMTVTAFLMGGGLTNLVTPTSGILMAYLAAARVGYGEWIRFIAPLFGLLCAVGFTSLFILTAMGF
jgi:uncharacterized ion transporter superfamily protein YfcC